MKMLNSVEGFLGASITSQSERLAVARIGGESFFISNCATYETKGKSGFTGLISRGTGLSEMDGLKSGEEVFFVPTR